MPPLEIKSALESQWACGYVKHSGHLSGWLAGEKKLTPIQGRFVSGVADKDAAKRLRDGRKVFAAYLAGKYEPRNGRWSGNGPLS